MSKKIIGLIPSRWGSVRFPGKPLAKISGKTMIERVYNRAMKAEILDELFVVTDDERIESECKKKSLRCILQKIDCHSGTDRIAQASKKLNADIFVNIQGDEPLIEPDAINSVAKCLIENDNCFVSNACTKVLEPFKAIDSDVVKVVVDLEENALFYSRSPIPYPKSSNYFFHQQLGLYAFKKNYLQAFLNLPPTPLELVEGVEMLRFLENGHKVRMVKVKDSGFSVDSPKDISYIEQKLNTNS